MASRSCLRGESRITVSCQVLSKWLRSEGQKEGGLRGQDLGSGGGMYGWIDGQTERQLYGWMDRRADKWNNQRVDKEKDWWMDKWMERKIDEHIRIFSLCSSEPIGAAAQNKGCKNKFIYHTLEKKESTSWQWKTCLMVWMGSHNIECFWARVNSVPSGISNDKSRKFLFFFKEKKCV